MKKTKQYFIKREEKLKAILSECLPYIDVTKLRQEVEAVLDSNCILKDGFPISIDCIVQALNENAALREQIAAKDEALRQAAILADIASDWNLDEIEIDGEMVLTYDLYKRFMQALEGSSATGEDE